MTTLILIAIVVSAVAIVATLREAVLDRPRATPRSHRVDPDLLPPGSRLT